MVYGMMQRQIRFQTLFLLLPLAAVFVLVGCLALGCGVGQLAKGELEAPEVRLQSLRLQPPSKEGWPLSCILDVKNPNSMTIKVLGYDYQVWVEGQSVARGAGDRAVTLPAQGEVQVEVPVLLKLGALPGLLPKVLQEKKLTVEIAGGLRLPQTLGLRVPFRFREEVTPSEGLDYLQPFLSR
jgi:LEA14-like dessication related protein